MSAEFHRQAEALFHEARDLPPGRRPAFLDERCPDDPALRAEVKSLLVHAQEDSEFMASPALDPRLDEELGDAASIEAGPEADRSANLPERIASYRVLSLLGEGGMAVVYLAEQDKPRRQVALKLLRPGIATPGQLHRFEKEAEILGRLHHPGIAQVFEAGTAQVDGRVVPYIAMERVEGKPLTSYADAAGLGTRERLGLLVQVCRAVDHAHQHGVIHRDLKPANIFVVGVGAVSDRDPPRKTQESRSETAPTAQPKVLDFGIARVTDADVRTTTLRTDVGQLIGTVAYMSPEQASGDPSQLDARSDVYALGVIGYELLAGHLPYDLSHKMIHEAVRVIREDDPTPLSAVNRIFRGDLETIVAKALEKDKPRRYLSAAALAADIERYLRDEPIVARPVSAVYQLRKFARRHRGMVMGAAGAALVLIVAAVGMTVLALRAVEQRKHAETAHQLAEQRRAEAEAARDNSDAVTRFLAEMLASINPQQLGRDVLLRDALQKAAETVKAGFADKPLIEGRLRLAIGESYRSLGELPAAAEHIGRAVELLRTGLGQRHPDTLMAMNTMAELCVDQGRRAEAEEIHRQVLAGRREVLGVEHRETLTSMSNLADVLQRAGRYGEAEPILRQALEARRRLLGEESAETLVSLNNLAMLLKNTGRPAEAAPLLRQVVDARVKLYGGEHPRTLTSTDNLAGALSDLGRPAEAEELYWRVLDVRRRVLGDEHPDTLVTLSSLGLLLHYRAREAEAEPLLQESLRGRRKVLGERHTRTLDSMNNLALVWHAEGRLDQAVPMMQEVLSARREVEGAEHPRTLGAMHNLGYMMCDAGQAEDGESLLRESLAASRRVLGDDHPATLGGMNRLAARLRRSGALDEALSLSTEAVERSDRTLPVQHPQRSASHAGYGECLNRLGRRSEAEPHLLQAASDLEATHGPEHPGTVEVIQGLVELYEQQDQADRADAWRCKLNPLAPTH